MLCRCCCDVIDPVMVEVASLTIIEQTDVHIYAAALLLNHEKVTTQSSGGQAKMCSTRRECFDRPKDAVDATSDLGHPTGNATQHTDHSDDTSAV